MWDCDTSGKTSEGSMFRRKISWIRFFWDCFDILKDCIDQPHRKDRTIQLSAVCCGFPNTIFHTSKSIRSKMCQLKTLKSMTTFTFEVVSQLLFFRFVLIFLEEKKTKGKSCLISDLLTRCLVKMKTKIPPQCLSFQIYCMYVTTLFTKL